MARRTSRTSAAPRPRRTFGDFVKAFLAFLALAALVFGVPVALASQIGWPFPDEVPSLDLLQQQITVDTFIYVLSVVVWLAWAQFTACVLVEVKAAVSGFGMPTRVPAAGASQALARQLVAALLLVTAGAASFAPGLSQLGQSLEDQHRPGVTASAQQTPGQQAQQAAQDRAAEQAESDRQAAEQAKQDGTKFYRIQPPEGRHHDSLWEISERHLGDGRRYSEIYELNKDRVQPDGEKLSKASLIRPGWIMEMPADAYGGDLVEMPDEAPKVSEKVREQIVEYSKSGDHALGSGNTAEKGAAASTGSVDRDTTQIVLPRDWATQDRSGAADSHADAAKGSAAGTGDHAQAADADDSSFGLPEALLASPLLAAGLLAALGRRRRTALWQSAMGAVTGRAATPPPVPTGEAANVQDALFVGADPEAVRRLDRSLRRLSEALTAASRPLPTVYAAWLVGGEIHLQLGDGEDAPPAPWQQGQDQTVWRLDEAAAEAAPAGDTAAPYPGLVSLGTVDGNRLLLNLESVPGVVSLTGGPEDRAAVMSSIAAELATNGWSDRMAITLVGFGEELGALAPSRLRHLPTIEDLLPVMEAETRQRAGALGAAGHDSILTGRSGHAQNNRWAPHLVLLAAEPTEAQAAELAALGTGAARLGIGYLIGTAVNNLPGAVWELEVTSDGRLLAPVLGLELRAQTLPRAQHEAVVQLFRDADGGAGHDPNPDPGAPPFLVDVTEQGRPAVYARLMGPFEIIGLESPDPDRAALMREALAMLLLHREGVNPRVLAAALWPRGVTDDVRDALIERLREWLGSDPDGTARLRAGAAGRLTLAPSVVSDLDVVRSLHHEATQGRGTRNAGIRERLLSDALDLVRGGLLPDRPEGRYGWLSHEIIDAQLPLLVTDVALALAEHRLGNDQPEQAIAALSSALTLSPADERLWNELLRATHATGDTGRLTSLAASLTTRAAELGGGRGLPPRTTALLDELLPTWRDDSAAAG
ncbi:BTAD domain-containing putative transcriptional regulator [Streptomyces sp. NPDC090045]|uniref:BTAD domain-containing putative transcriptional regulator n=1 Tax=Streptomyces sp. NPDC090045 TaxID=3365927 RepID=UPI00382C0747